MKRTIGMDELMEWKHLPGAAVSQYLVSRSHREHLHSYAFLSFQFVLVMAVLMSSPERGVGRHFDLFSVCMDGCLYVTKIIMHVSLSHFGWYFSLVAFDNDSVQPIVMSTQQERHVKSTPLVLVLCAIQ